jgi:arabinofuranosyltransferase
VTAAAAPPPPPLPEPPSPRPPIAVAARSPRWWLAFAVAWLALVAIVVRLAWLGDDSYITLRSVENWCTGHGPTWNTGERVQTYTHPAWMLVLAAGRALTGEVYFTTIAISVALAATAIALLLRFTANVPALVAAAVLLAGTRVFGEYATSGLETPLTMLLLVLLVRTVLAPAEPLRHYRRVVLLAALLATNRMDLALLCAPVALAALRGVRWRDALVQGLLAASPFLAWLAFAWFYYGSPLPVTAHAKAFGTGIPAAELWQQGLHYVAFALHDDPVLLPAIVAGVAVGLLGRGTRALALGALLYCGYVVRVGGDFMAGRFFLPPFVVAVAITARWLARQRPAVAWAVAVVVAGLAAVRGVPAWALPPANDTPPDATQIEAQHGIVDERRVYYRHLGLFGADRDPPVFGSLQHAVDAVAPDRRWFLLSGAVGTTGFRAGAHGHVVDPMLCDPLLARLPARDPARWRIGHVLRRVPEGYWDTLRSGENRLRHPGLRAWYGALRSAISGPVLDAGRLAAVARLALGTHDAGFRAFVADEYFAPPRVPLPAASLPPALPLGTYWFEDERLHVIHDGGVALALATPRTADRLRLQVLGLTAFRCRFVRGGTVVGEAFATPLPSPAHLPELRRIAGLREEEVAVPSGVGAFDELWLDAVANEFTHTSPGPPALGAVTLAP